MANFLSSLLQGEQLFDRCIDLDFYKEGNVVKPLYRLRTLPTGQKPDITIKGTMVDRGSDISTDITVTNLNSAISTQQIDHIVAYMYYGGGIENYFTESAKARLTTAYVFRVLFCDDSKQPPDRQTTFHCIEASWDIGVVGRHFKLDMVNATEPVPMMLPMLLAQWITQYNKASIGAFGRVLQPLSQWVDVQINPTAYAKIKVLAPCTGDNLTLYQVLSVLNAQLGAPVKMEEGTTVAPACYITIIENRLAVIPTASSEITLSAIEKNPFAVRVDTVMSAYRDGPIVHMRIPFNNRIRPHVTVMTKGALILGKRVAGKGKDVVAIGEFPHFRVLPGVQFEFSTCSGSNYMQLQGVLYD